MHVPESPQHLCAAIIQAYGHRTIRLPVKTLPQDLGADGAWAEAEGN